MPPSKKIEFTRLLYKDMCDHKYTKSLIYNFKKSDIYILNS